MKYFVDMQGRYLGAWDQGGPDGAIEVASAPNNARQPWLGDHWGEVKKSQDQINAEARTYLLSTDWYVTRWMENQTPIPGNVSALREAARESVIP